MKHYIIAKFQEGITKGEKQSMLPGIRELFEHTREIEGIHGVRVIANCVERENRFDVMIEITMEPESLPLYDACIWHRRWKEEYGPLLQKKAIFDAEE